MFERHNYGGYRNCDIISHVKHELHRADEVECEVRVYPSRLLASQKREFGTDHETRTDT